MREDFLHYVWRFQKFNAKELQISCGQSLQIEKVGTPNPNAGPDFLMGQIVIANQRWIGHIEIHLKASDWFNHGHQDDPNYETVILHVVWENDKSIELPNGGNLPVLELKKRIDPNLLQHYHQLMAPSTGMLPCENDFGIVPELVMKKWLERLFLERLEKKCELLVEWLEQTKYHWEAVCLLALTKAFGMKVNAEAFLSVVQSVDFAILQKCKSHPIVMEALLLGQAGLLEGECSDPFFQSLKAAYQYLIHKFKLQREGVVRPQFFRLRPANFPTLRFSQLAVLWSKHSTMMGVFKTIETRDQAYQTLSVESSNYWRTHYRFGKESSTKVKRLSRPFIDLLLINVILPLQFLYGQAHGTIDFEKMESLAQDLPMESNTILSRFQEVRYFEQNAMNGQALLQLHTNYCKQVRCTSCEVGNFILKLS